MSIASFSGLASGIQWRDLLDQVGRAETARRLTPVQREVSLEQNRITQLNRFRGIVDSLGSAARALRDGSAFDRFTVDVENSALTGRTLLAASASASAAPGTYNVEVLSLARAHTMASGSHADSAGDLGLSGSFSINGKEIVVESSDSLAAIRDRINAANAGVTAGVVMASPGTFRLTLTSTEAGAAGIDYRDGGQNVGAALGLTLDPRSDATPSAGFSTAGSDAQLRINGITVSRQSNTISDAVAGLTLNLRQAEPGAEVAITVARDQEAVSAAVKRFVDAYNEVRNTVDLQTADASQALARSSVLRTALSGLKNVLLTDVEGAAIPRLTLVGVSLTRNGQLEIDNARLSETSNSNLGDLKELLAGVGSRIHGVVDTITRADGMVATQVKSHNNSIGTLNRRADEIQARLDRQNERMERDFIAMEKALSQINAQGNWLTQQIAAMQPAKR